MSDQQVHVFMPSMDGEYVPVKFTSAQKDLKEKEVLIFVNEGEKRIFIWTGANSNVRKRFISSQIARQMRLEKGLTHRISTEDQGNETKDFLEFIDEISISGVKAGAPIDVSPPSMSTPISSLEFVDDSEVIPPPKKESASPITSKAPKKAPTTTMVKEVEKSEQTITSPVKPPVKPPVEVKRSDIMYYYQDQNAEITPDKGQLIFTSIDENSVLEMIHISSAATDGKIEFYYFPKSAKTTSCKGKKPFFVIYLRPNTKSVIEIDDLEIPIPAGNSIYFTCPADTFVSLNLVKD